MDKLESMFSLPNMLKGKYKLKHRKPVPVKSLEEWYKAQDTYKRRVRSTRIGGYWVSTVFLSISYSGRDDSAPLLFETMIFEGGNMSGIGYTDRCGTWREALAMHWQAVELIKKPTEMSLYE